MHLFEYFFLQVPFQHFVESESIQIKWMISFTIRKNYGTPTPMIFSALKFKNRCTTKVLLYQNKEKWTNISFPR